MATSDVTTLMSALTTSATNGVKRAHAEIDNSQSFNDYLEQNRSREQVRSRPASASSNDRQASVEHAKNNEPRAGSRQEAAELKSQQGYGSDKSQPTEARSDKALQGSEPKPNDDDSTAAGSAEVDASVESSAGVFVLKSAAAEFIDNSSELGFKSGQVPLQLDSEALLEPELADAIETSLVGVQIPAAAISVAQAGSVRTSNLSAVAAGGEAEVAQDLELELADGTDTELDSPAVAKKVIGSGLTADAVGTAPKNLADIKAADLTKLDGNKTDLPVSPTTAKAAIEHAQGTSGLNHSYLTDRNASVQGRAIMQSPMMAKQWDTEMAEKVAWFAAKNISSAEIRLDPPELGSLHIRINVNHEQGQVQLNFVSPHANVREALDQSASRLRDMFDEQGMDLVDVDVSSQQQDGKGEQAENALADGGSEDELVQQQEVQQLAPLSNSLVDSYA